MDKYEQLKEIIKKSKNIVVFTGAGISVPSGIPDFRSSSGLYNQKNKFNIPAEETISHTFFMNNTADFYSFYKEKMCFPNALPNIAHKYIANLENKNKRVIVVTQNIDGLHQKAGSSIVYELHGSVHRNYCQKCHKSVTLDDILKFNDIPYCDKCGGIIKPDVVLYEEPLDDIAIERAISAIMTSDTLIIIGTSLTVYPAAGYIRYFKGNNLVVINKDETNYDSFCSLVINDDITNVIKKIS